MAKKSTSLYPQFRAGFLCPKYWPLWLGVGLLKTLQLLPFNTQLKVGSWLGKLLFFTAKKRRRIAQQNMHIGFPDLSKSQQYTLLKQHFDNLGISIIEAGIAWWGSHRKHPQASNIKQHFTFKGVEHLEKAQTHGTGVILLTPHFTTVEMLLLGISLVAKLNPVYRPHNDALMDYLIRTGRSAPRINEKTGLQENTNPVANSDTRQMLNVLRRGENIALLPDQRYRSKKKVIVPFLGRDAKSNPATSKIAKLTGCQVVPVFCRRLEGFNYELEFLPALENFPGSSPESDTIRLHHLYENEIKHNPAQYLWVHNRWDIK